MSFNHTLEQRAAYLEIEERRCRSIGQYDAAVQIQHAVALCREGTWPMMQQYSWWARGNASRVAPWFHIEHGLFSVQLRPGEFFMFTPDQVALLMHMIQHYETVREEHPNSGWEIPGLE